MDITIERTLPITEEIFQLLRAAPLGNTGDEEIFIYRDATMRLADLWPDTLNLTSLYLLKSRLAFQRDLHAHLLEKYGVDTLRLSSVLLLRNGDKLFGMMPLYVEVYQERVQLIRICGDRPPPRKTTLRIPILKDGIHRAAIARERRQLVRCVEIHGALENHPPYAYPNSWEQVVLCDKIPAVRKLYRRQDPYTNMRPTDALRSAAGAPPTTEYGRAK